MVPSSQSSPEKEINISETSESEVETKSKPIKKKAPTKGKKKVATKEATTEEKRPVSPPKKGESKVEAPPAAKKPSKSNILSECL